jgi:hypothetical protein
MHSRFRFTLLLAVACIFAAIPAAAGPSASMGVVVGASNASIGHASAIDGTAVYDGDTVSTEANGAMRLQFGASQIYLSSNAIVTFHKTDTGVEAVLERGNVRFATAPGSPLTLRALNDHVGIRSKGNMVATGQLSIISPNVFEVGSIKGDLDVSVNGNDREVDESNAYRVTVPDSEPSGGGGAPSTPGAGASYGIWIPISLIIAGTIAAIVLAVISPSK